MRSSLRHSLFLSFLLFLLPKLLLAQADLILTQTTPSNVFGRANSLVLYTFQLINNGPGVATNVTLSETVTPGAVFARFGNSFPPGTTVSSPAYGTSGPVSITFPSLAPGAIQTVILERYTDFTTPGGVFSIGDVITSTATLSATTPDPDLGNNTSTVTSTVRTFIPDYGVTKGAQPVVKAGDNLVYTILFTSTNIATFDIITLTDVLPSGTTFVSVSVSSGFSSSSFTTPPVGSGGSVVATLSLFSIIPDRYRVFTLVAHVGNAVANGMVLNNTVTLSGPFSPGANPLTANDQSTATTTIFAPGPLVYFSKPDGRLDNVRAWGENPDGSGANPTDFGAGKIFNLANRGTVYFLAADWTIGGILNIPVGSELRIGGFVLAESGITGGGTLTGSPASSLYVIGSSGPNLLNFTPGGGLLYDLIIQNGASASVGSPLSIYHWLYVLSGALNTGNLITLKSGPATTAVVAPLLSGSFLTGTVTAEQYIPARRAWRLVNAPVVHAAGSASGSATLTNSQENPPVVPATSTGVPRPVSFGTAFFSLDTARTALRFTATVFNIDVTGSQTPDLNDNLVAAHIHVGAPPGANAPVRWGFFGTPFNDNNPTQLVITPFASGVGGTFTSTWDLPEGNGGTNLTSNLPGILAGQAYINFHTVQFGGGEIRGQISLLPDTRQDIKQSWQEGAAGATDNPAPGFGTHITGGPVFGSAANGFDINPTGVSESSLKYYDNASNNWLPVDATSGMPVGLTPFMLFVRGNRGITLDGPAQPANATVLRATGALVSGNVTYNVAPAGYTAIPNPYQAPVDFATITRNNVQNLFYVWDPKLGGAFGVGAYITVSWNGSTYDVTPAPVSPESRYIQPWQSFLVASTGAAGTLTIRETDKVPIIFGNVFRTVKGTTDQPPAGEPVSNSGVKQSVVQRHLRVNLKVENADGTMALVDEVLASFSTDYADKVDKMDVPKMPNIRENLALLRNGQDLTMERRSLINAKDTLFLKITGTEKGNYRLTFAPANPGTSLPAFLEDGYLHTSAPISLTGNTEVAFRVTADEASKNPARFRVVFGASRMQDVLAANSIGAEVSPNPVREGRVNLRLLNQLQGVYSIKLVNSAGQVVAERKIQHSGGTATHSIQTTGRLAKGIYQLSISKDKATTTLKIMAD